MFHQLHCLGEIRRFYWIFFDGLLAGNGTEEYEKAMKYANAMTKIDNGHISHCIDYIRQGIMCAGDMVRWILYYLLLDFAQEISLKPWGR